MGQKGYTTERFKNRGVVCANVLECHITKCNLCYCEVPHCNGFLGFNGISLKTKEGAALLKTYCDAPTTHAVESDIEKYKDNYMMLRGLQHCFAHQGGSGAPDSPYRQVLALTRSLVSTHEKETPYFYKGILPEFPNLATCQNEDSKGNHPNCCDSVWSNSEIGWLGPRRSIPPKRANLITAYMEVLSNSEWGDLFEGDELTPDTYRVNFDNCETRGQRRLKGELMRPIWKLPLLPQIVNFYYHEMGFDSMSAIILGHMSVPNEVNCDYFICADYLCCENLVDLYREVDPAEVDYISESINNTKNKFNEFGTIRGDFEEMVKYIGAKRR